MQLGRHAHVAKLDVKSAFRLCPVHPSEHHLLGMHWQGRYYFDRVLPFSLRSAPFIFNCLTSAVQWLARQQIDHVHHYLDDFFITGPPHTTQCSQHLCSLTSLCEHLGIPLAEDKLEDPATQLEYLGILLDLDALEARLPPDKLQDIKTSPDPLVRQNSVQQARAPAPHRHTELCSQGCTSRSHLPPQDGQPQHYSAPAPEHHLS